MEESPLLAHNQYQMAYYRRRVDRSSIRPTDTPYVRRHFEAVRAGAALDAGQRVLEVGCGSGRFTRLLLDLGLEVVANDLSPDLLAALRSPGAEIAAEAQGRLETVPGDVLELPVRIRHRADRAVGFFVLHHLYDLAAAFAALASTLRPGARVAFCEPNAWCPLFYLQILLTPGMTWRAERGIRQMTPGRVLSAMARGGFTDLHVERYGFFPPQLANRSWGRALERRLEASATLRGASAFQVFSGRC